jgi:hypothetical protein
MPRHNLAGLGFAVIGAIASAACSTEPPVAPAATADGDLPLSA